MTRPEAKEILLLYRPGTRDADDPEVAAAMVLAEQDAELGRWFVEHCAVQEILRQRFQEIATPEGLKEQIVSEHDAWRKRERWRQPTVLAAIAAVCVLTTVLATIWLRPHSDKSFAAFRQRMAGTALRIYNMDLETNDVSQIRAYLAEHHAHADYVLPKPLAATPSTGCGVLRWQNRTVSMVCFHSGKPLPPGEKSDLFLFVIDRAAVPDAPGVDTPQFTTVNRLTTASWAAGDKYYVLAGAGDEAFLRTYF